MGYHAWYSSDFHTAPTGRIVGHDGWREWSVNLKKNANIESFYVSDTYFSPQELSCETAKSSFIESAPALGVVINGFDAVSRDMDRHDGGYQLDMSLLLDSVTDDRAFIQIRMADGNDLNPNWIFKLDGSGNAFVGSHTESGSTKKGGGGTEETPLGGPYCVGTPGALRIIVDSQSNLSIYIDNMSTPVFEGLSNGSAADILQLATITQNFLPSTTPFAVGDIVLLYNETSSDIIPKAPANVMANARENYTVVSWDKVTNGIVDGLVTRSGASPDSVGSTGLATSPHVIRAVIDGYTLTNNLPVEGRDFSVNKQAGTITWSTSSTAVVPDNSTVYEVTYEMPINNVTTYNVYKSNLLNEFDRRLYRAVTGVDVDGFVDTAIPDTSDETIQVYRVATVDANVVESEVSDKAMIVKAATQADDKKELVDRTLFTLDSSLLDEGLLR